MTTFAFKDWPPMWIFKRLVKLNVLIKFCKNSPNQTCLVIFLNENNNKVSFKKCANTRVLRNTFRAKFLPPLTCFTYKWSSLWLKYSISKTSVTAGFQDQTVGNVINEKLKKVKRDSLMVSELFYVCICFLHYVFST